MEFNNIRKPDLLNFAQSKGLEVTEDNTVPQIDEALTAAAYTKDDFDEFMSGADDDTNDEPEEVKQERDPALNTDTMERLANPPTPEVPLDKVISKAPNNEETVGRRTAEAKDEQVLVRMDRNNMSYSAGKHVFTRNHPFVVMDKSDADQFLKYNEGFHIASADEAERFYA